MGRRNHPSSRGLPCQSAGCKYIAEEGKNYCCNRCKDRGNIHGRNCTAVFALTPQTNKHEMEALKAKIEYLKRRLLKRASASAQAVAESSKAEPKRMPGNKKQRIASPYDDSPCIGILYRDECPFIADAAFTGHVCEPNCMNWRTSLATGWPEQVVIYVDASDDDPDGSDMD